jgi:eukaryotic-like serine/threonine-protein kinase
LAYTLLAEEKFVEAEVAARESLAIREKKLPDDWRTFNARSMLGASLLGQKKYSAAEPFLLAGYEGIKQREAKIPSDGKIRLHEAIERLVRLYDAADQPGKAAEWKQRLTEFDQVESEKPPAASKP